VRGLIYGPGENLARDDNSLVDEILNVLNNSNKIGYSFIFHIFFLKTVFNFIINNKSKEKKNDFP